MSTTVAYDISITLLGMVVPMVVVGTGLLLPRQCDELLRTLAADGLVTGIGVAAVHCTGFRRS